MDLKNFDAPEFEEDGSKGWKPLMQCLQRRINQLQRMGGSASHQENRGREVRAEDSSAGNTVGATWKGLPFEPVGIKAVQGHNRWVTDSPKPPRSSVLEARF